eukprot:COSAG04_NODE_8605_length_952_cov_0.985932_2_plen_210_part_00
MDSDIQNIGKHVANRHSWPLTLEYCAQICHDMGKTIAGVVRPAPPAPAPTPAPKAAGPGRHSEEPHWHTLRAHTRVHAHAHPFASDRIPLEGLRGGGGCRARADTHGVLGRIAQPEALCSATGGKAGCGSNPCSQPCSACPNTQRCNTTVNGNRTELCGSGGHVGAYRFNCSGSPVPRPWPPPPPPPCHGNGDPGCGALYKDRVPCELR